MSAVRLLPWPVHQVLDYLSGVFFVLAPFLLGFRNHETAVPLFIAVGVVELAVAVASPKPLGVVGVLPVKVHAAVDYLTGFFLILAPFLFGFTREEPALLTSIFVGLATVVVALVTAYPLGDEERGQPDTP